MPKVSANWSIDMERMDFVKREAARRSDASGTKVSESATVNALLREAEERAEAGTIETDKPATAKFGNPLIRQNLKPGSK